MATSKKANRSGSGIRLVKGLHGHEAPSKAECNPVALSAPPEDEDVPQAAPLAIRAG